MILFSGISHSQITNDESLLVQELEENILIKNSCITVSHYILASEENNLKYEFQFSDTFAVLHTNIASVDIKNTAIYTIKLNQS